MWIRLCRIIDSSRYLNFKVSCNDVAIHTIIKRILRFWYYYYITIGNFFNFKISYSFEIFFVYSRMKWNHFQSAFSPLERIVNIRAILTAKYRHVTDLTEVVCSVVKLENSVSKVIICCCWKYVYSLNMHFKVLFFL